MSRAPRPSATTSSPPPGEGTLSDVQAEAILNMRLRSLRRLEEMELRAERDALQAERAELEDLLEEGAAMGQDRSPKLRETRKSFGKARRRRAPHHLCRGGAVVDVPLRHDRARADHGGLLAIWAGSARSRGTPRSDAALKFKDGDGPRFASMPRPPTSC